MSSPCDICSSFPCKLTPDSPRCPHHSKVDPKVSEFINPIKTSEVLSAVRIRQKAPAGHMHVIIAIDPKSQRELEVFAMIGKSGGVPAGNLEATCRMISLYLRIGGTLENVVEQLEGVGSNITVPSKEGTVLSMGDALSKAIRKYLEAKQKHGLDAILTGEVDFEVVDQAEQAKQEAT